MRGVGGAEKQYSQDPHTRIGDPQTGGQLKLRRFFPRRTRSKPYTGLLSPWILHQEDKSPECLTLRVNRACIWESQKATGNKDSTFKWLPWWLRQYRICLQCGRPEFDPWIWKIPWKREWLPTPLFLPGESHGQKSLLGYSPWGYKEMDMTEQLTHTHNLIIF